MNGVCVKDHTLYIVYRPLFCRMESMWYKCSYMYIHDHCMYSLIDKIWSLRVVSNE